MIADDLILWDLEWLARRSNSKILGRLHGRNGGVSGEPSRIRRTLLRAYDGDRDRSTVP